MTHEKVTFKDLESVWIEFNEIIMQDVSEKESASEMEVKTVLDIYSRLSSISRQLEELREILNQENNEILAL